MNYKIKKEEISLELPSNSLIAVLVGRHNINLVKLEKLMRMAKYSLMPGKFSNASMNFTTLGLPSSASLLHNRIFAK